MKNLPVVFQFAGLATFFTGVVMMLIHMLNSVGYKKMIMLNDFGIWVESFNADAKYSMIILAVMVTGFIILFAGKFIQLVNNEK